MEDVCLHLFNLRARLFLFYYRSFWLSSVCVCVCVCVSGEVFSLGLFVADAKPLLAARSGTVFSSVAVPCVRMCSVKIGNVEGVCRYQRSSRCKDENRFSIGRKS